MCSTCSIPLVNRNYYDYLTTHFEVVEGIRYASADDLVCLKALAYLNLISDKQAGKKVNTDDIKKHRRDVIMAAAYLPAGERYKVGGSIRKMLDDFLLAVEDTSIRKSLKDSLRIDDDTLDGILEVLKEGFVV